MKKIIYNPKNGASIKDFRWMSQKPWSLAVNTMAKFPDIVATELLNRYGFLREIKPEDIQKTLKLMEVKELKCEHCEFETNSEPALKAHMTTKHEITAKTQEIMDSIADAGEIEYLNKPVDQSIDFQEGIPKGERDGWYGAGLEEDVPTASMRGKKTGGGNFLAN